MFAKSLRKCFLCSFARIQLTCTCSLKGIFDWLSFLILSRKINKCQVDFLVILKWGSQHLWQCKMTTVRGYTCSFANQAPHFCSYLASKQIQNTSVWRTWHKFWSISTAAVTMVRYSSGKQCEWLFCHSCSLFQNKTNPFLSLGATAGSQRRRLCYVVIPRHLD